LKDGTHNKVLADKVNSQPGIKPKIKVFLLFQFANVDLSVIGLSITGFIPKSKILISIFE